MDAPENVTKKLRYMLSSCEDDRTCAAVFRELILPMTELIDALDRAISADDFFVQPGLHSHKDNDVHWREADHIMAKRAAAYQSFKDVERAIKQAHLAIDNVKDSK